MNIVNIISEEIQRLFEQEVYTIPELAKLMGRLGHHEDSFQHLEKMLSDAYRKNGDKGVIDLFAQMAGVEIQALRNGRYMFANLYTPENNDGYLE